MTDQHRCADSSLDHLRLRKSDTIRVGAEWLVASADVQANGWTVPGEFDLA